ncbi:MAG TPA: hypothetical protein DCZ10_16600 [Pelotomaculum sp.]|jgi:hypothetical protein|nr:hypothetical protein [Pelotomaculum sp.]
MISAWWLLALTLLFLVMMEYREYEWRLERKDLYNRIMAGGLNEYRNEVKEKPPPRGGNMVRAGLEKAQSYQMKMLGGDG